MDANESGMITEDSIFDPVKDARPPMDAEVLEATLMDKGTPAWLADAVVEAVGNGDLLYLRRQVERHVDGWVTP